MLVAICREVDKITGEILVYEMEARVTNELVQQMSRRQRINHQLQYFITYWRNWSARREEIETVIGRRELTREDVERIGGIIRVM